MGGRILRVGGKLTKDVAGYDLVRLLVGSEGTLAVLTEITLKLLPAPEAKATGAAYFRDLEASARSVSRIIEKRILPATLEFLDQATMRVVDESADLGLPADAGAMLIFGQDGHASVVERDTAAMAEICREEGAISVEVAADEDAAGKLLAARRGAIPALARLAPTLILEDVDGAALRARRRWCATCSAIAEEEGLLIAVFGHAGDGNLHPTCCIDERDPDQVARVHRAFDRIFDGRPRARRDDHGRARRSASPSCSTSSSASAPSASTCCAASSAHSTRWACSIPARPCRERAGGRAAGARSLPRRPAAHVHLLRLLPLGLPHLPGHAQRGLLAAWAHQPHAGARGGHPGRGRRARGALLLPRLPRLRAGLPRRRALRHPARACAATRSGPLATPSCAGCCWPSARRAERASPAACCASASCSGCIASRPRGLCARRVARRPWCHLPPPGGCAARSGRTMASPPRCSSAASAT